MSKNLFSLPMYPHLRLDTTDGQSVEEGLVAFRFPISGFRFSSGISMLALLFLTLSLTAQPALYLTREFEQAVEAGTRTLAGQPGPNYWQNRAGYTIDVRVIPSEKRIEGQASIDYTNNSPDTLRQLNLKLIQNIHLPQARKDSYVDRAFLTTGISLSDIRVNGEEAAWDNAFVQQSGDP
ncbi:MAG: hypothetical protein KDD06_14540, partial [Phaeodactylibacter sp.]|nr:hypothetical protein [Phaeodactylibacter sp.]